MQVILHSNGACRHRTMININQNITKEYQIEQSSYGAHIVLFEEFIFNDNMFKFFSFAVDDSFIISNQLKRWLFIDCHGCSTKNFLIINWFPWLSWARTLLVFIILILFVKIINTWKRPWLSPVIVSQHVNLVWWKHVISLIFDKIFLKCSALSFTLWTRT